MEGSADIVVCVATELEGRLLVGGQVTRIVSGIGAVNAAIALTRYLERCRTTLPAAVINCGIAGAYPAAFEEHGFSTGAVAWAESECYGDLGAADPQDGFLDLRAMGFPLLGGEHPVYNELPLQLHPPSARRAKFVTVNTCTGTDESARRIEARTGGSVESMEGAAIAHVARLYGIPCGGVRGISNRAGDRDRSTWRIRDAAEAAQLALLEWTRNWRRPSSAP